MTKTLSPEGARIVSKDGEVHFRICQSPVVKYDIKAELFRRLFDLIKLKNTSGERGGRSMVRRGHRFGDCEAVDV